MPETIKGRGVKFHGQRSLYRSTVDTKNKKLHGVLKSASTFLMTELALSFSNVMGNVRILVYATIHARHYREGGGGGGGYTACSMLACIQSSTIPIVNAKMVARLQTRVNLSGPIATFPCVIKPLVALQLLVSNSKGVG